MNGGMNYWIVKHTAPYRGQLAPSPGPNPDRWIVRGQGRLFRREISEISISRISRRVLLDDIKLSKKIDDLLCCRKWRFEEK